MNKEKIIIYEWFKDIWFKNKPYCLSTSKGYFNFYTKKELLSFIIELKGGLK